MADLKEDMLVVGMTNSKGGERLFRKPADGFDG